jgi:hypothetical protein
MDVRVRVSLCNDNQRDHIIAHIRAIAKGEPEIDGIEYVFVTTKTKYFEFSLYLKGFPGYLCRLVDRKYKNNNEYSKSWYRNNRDKHIKNVDNDKKIKRGIKNNRRSISLIINKALLKTDLHHKFVDTRIQFSTLVTILGCGLIEGGIIVNKNQLDAFYTKSINILNCNIEKAYEELCKMSRDMGGAL